MIFKPFIFLFILGSAYCQSYGSQKFEQQIDSRGNYDSSGSQENEEGYGNSVEGEGVPEPPALVPQTSFTCDDKPYQPGMYADLEVDCTVYHMCFDGRKESFLCGTGTVFNQEILSCDHPQNVDCQSSPSYYSANTELGKPGAEPGPGGQAPAPGPRPAPPPRPGPGPRPVPPPRPVPGDVSPPRPGPGPRPAPVPAPVRPIRPVAPPPTRPLRPEYETPDTEYQPGAGVQQPDYGKIPKPSKPRPEKPSKVRPPQPGYRPPPAPRPQPPALRPQPPAPRPQPPAPRPQPPAPRPQPPAPRPQPPAPRPQPPAPRPQPPAPRPQPPPYRPPPGKPSKVRPPRPGKPAPRPRPIPGPVQPERPVVQVQEEANLDYEPSAAYYIQERPGAPYVRATDPRSLRKWQIMSVRY